MGMDIELIATVRPKNNQPFPIVLSNDIQGGIHYVEDSGMLKSIPEKRRLSGMLCYVKNDQFYQLEDDLITWTSIGNFKNLSTKVYSNLSDVNNIENPVKGQMVFVENDYNNEYLYFWNGTEWKSFNVSEVAYNYTVWNIEIMNNLDDDIAVPIGAFCFVETSGYMYFYTGIEEPLEDGTLSKWKKLNISVDMDLSRYAIKSEVEERLSEKANVIHTHEYTEILNHPEIPSLDGYATKDYVDKKFEQIGAGSGSGANVYIGEEPPQDTSMIWVDSSTPYTLEPNTYENRLKNNYVMMLNNSYGKISTIESGLTSLQNAIDKITSQDNAQKVTDFNIKLNVMMDDCNLLKDKLTKSKTSIINNSLSSSLKAEAKKVRKEVKTFIYSLYDLKHQIMQVIDSERITIVIPEEPVNPDKPPVTIVDNYLLTEDGFTLLTEDGLMLIVDKETTQQLIAPNILTELGLSILTEDGMLILADGMDEVTFTDAILTELGLNILTEDGKVLLVDGVENDNSTETLVDAILTELGLTLLTENGKQILKG